MIQKQEFHSSKIFLDVIDVHADKIWVSAKLIYKRTVLKLFLLFYQLQKR